MQSNIHVPDSNALSATTKSSVNVQSKTAVKLRNEKPFDPIMCPSFKILFTSFGRFVALYPERKKDAIIPFSLRMSKSCVVLSLIVHY